MRVFKKLFLFQWEWEGIGDYFSGINRNWNIVFQRPGIGMGMK